MTVAADISPKNTPKTGAASQATMRAARYYKVGAPFVVDIVDRPTVRADEVIVQVKACGLVPNYSNVLQQFQRPDDTDPGLAGPSAPALPAIYGLDAAGVIVEKGSMVHGLEIGDRVYVNPLRYCGACVACRRGDVRGCEYTTLSAYFGLGPKAPQMLADYPYGGFGEYMNAPQSSLVKLPDNLPFEIAARWGYLGTGYGAVRAGKVDMTTTVLINGATGTLGLGATVFALAMGAKKVFAVGRNMELLERLKKIAPGRIDILSVSGGESIADWVRPQTDGRGVDVVIDALPTGAPGAALLAAFRALARGGRHVNVGGVLAEVPINFIQVMNDAQTLIGSLWFTTAEGQEMADLAESETVDLKVFDTKVFPLDQINEALAEIHFGCGGFTNYVIAPDR